VFVEDFRRELAEIQLPVARHLYVLAKLRHFAHLQMGEYAALIEAADLAGHHGVGLLLETCLADKMAFAERTRRFIRRAVEEKIMENVPVGAR
jgi:ferritin-like metal-binding protein YciE